MNLKILDTLTIIDIVSNSITKAIPYIINSSRQHVINELELIYTTYKGLIGAGYNNEQDDYIITNKYSMRAFYFAMIQIKIMIIDLFNECQELMA